MRFSSINNNHSVYTRLNSANACFNLISQLSTKQALDLIDDGTITGGMIPKIKTCISAIESGVNGVVIIDGRKSHAVLFELFSNLGAGTLIVK